MSSEQVCCFKISSSALFLRWCTDELPVIWTGKDGMDDRERKLSFCDIFAEALVVCVLCVLKILIIVSDLEQNSNQVDKGDIVTTFSNYREWWRKHVAWTTCLHEFDGQTEETAGFVVDHLDIFFFRGTSQTISPEKIHPLSTMKVD